MSYERTPDYHEGQTIMACGICGMSYLFPTELTMCDDRIIRCKRTCMEETALSRDRKIANSHVRRDINPPPFGIPTSYGRGIATSFACTGGSVVGGSGAGVGFGPNHGTVTVPLLDFALSMVGRSLRLTGTSDIDNEGPHVIIAVPSIHKVAVANAMADQALTAAMTASVS